MTSLTLKRRPKRGKGKKRSSSRFLSFLVRVSNFSLHLQAIRPSKFVETRRKGVLRGEAYVWTPVLGVFVKLQEVGDLSYLGFTLYLSVL